MRSKREKGYWLKTTEWSADGRAARARAGSLRLDENVAHVTTEKRDEGWVISYSVAKWYFEECVRIGIKV